MVLASFGSADVDNWGILFRVIGCARGYWGQSMEKKFPLIGEYLQIEPRCIQPRKINPYFSWVIAPSLLLSCPFCVDCLPSSFSLSIVLNYGRQAWYCLGPRSSSWLFDASCKTILCISWWRRGEKNYSILVILGSTSVTIHRQGYTFHFWLGDTLRAWALSGEHSTAYFDKDASSRISWCHRIPFAGKIDNLWYWFHYPLPCSLGSCGNAIRFPRNPIYCRKWLFGTSEGNNAVLNGSHSRFENDLLPKGRTTELPAPSKTAIPFETGFCRQEKPIRLFDLSTVFGALSGVSVNPSQLCVSRRGCLPWSSGLHGGIRNRRMDRPKFPAQDLLHSRWSRSGSGNNNHDQIFRSRRDLPWRSRNFLDPRWPVGKGCWERKILPGITLDKVVDMRSFLRWK